MEQAVEFSNHKDFNENPGDIIIIHLLYIVVALRVAEKLKLKT